MDFKLNLIKMKYSLDLTYETPIEWAHNAVKDFNSFLQDHADCERKASAMAMSFVAKCPDKPEIIPELIEVAIEELEHFRDCWALLQDRGITLPAKMEEDIYIKKLIGLCRSSRDERLMDRMLIASIVEMRGMERFKLIGDVIEDPELKRFYKQIWASEAKHGTIFVRLALNYWDEETIYKRLDELNQKEGEICESLPWRSAVH